MSDRVQHGRLHIAAELYEFMNNEALPGTGIEPKDFWSAFDGIVHDLTPKNRELLQ